MSRRFSIHETGLPGVFELRRARMGDDRGFLERMFCLEELAAIGWAGSIAQINRTLTRAPGAVRGMHYQRAPHAEIKLVSCLAGQVYDVALDLREGSATYGQHAGCVLDPDISNALLIPEGCAHGFQTLSEDCEMLYCHSKSYAPAHEAGVNAFDPALEIAWPLPQGQRSDRDETLPTLALAQPSGVFPA